jgi:hypothetical protein
MPSGNRSQLLKRALGSVLAVTASVAEQVEVTVSDGSVDDASRQVAGGCWPTGLADTDMCSTGRH